MQYNYRNRFLVILDVIDADVYVYIYEKYKFYKLFLYLKPKHIFIGKSKVCEMTEFSGAADNSSDFDGNTLLLHCENKGYVYVSGFEIFKLKTDGKFIDYISLMGNNMILYAIIIGEKYTYFIYTPYKIIENNKIAEGTSLNTINGVPFDYHLEKCGVDSLRKLECSPIHSKNSN